MTYKELIGIIEKVASQQPNIRTIVPFSPYDVNKSKETEYSVFSWSPNAFTESNEFINYSLNLFYIDRLSADSSNKLQIQSIGIQVLKNILDVLENDYGLQTTGNRTYQTFYETFDKNVCAGVFVTITFATEFADCPELYE